MGAAKGRMKILAASFFVILSVFLCCQNANASSYSDCIDASGGRGGIDSVQWACNGYVPWNSDSACTLWIGSSSSQDTVIEVSKLSGKETAYMWGMCTKGAYYAGHVKISNDNGSFSYNGSRVDRGKWGSPKSTPISVDIARFTSGVTPVQTSSGVAYTRNVNIYRCFQNKVASDYAGACSSQYSNVTVLIKIVKLGTITVKGNSKITSVDNAILEGNIYQATDDNVTAHFEHGLYQSNDYGLSLSQVSYGLYSALDRSTALSNRVVVSDTKDSNKVNHTVALSTADTIIDFCQNISFKSKTWNILKNLVTNNIYTEPQNDTGQSIAACAKVHHPWNFKINDIEVTPPEDNIVYAGEHASLNYNLIVNKNNDNYPITDIPNASVSVCAEYNGINECQTLYDKKTMHNNGTIDNNTNYGYNASASSYSVNIFKNDWTVPDLPAGTEYCLTLSVTPLNSGNGYYSNFDFSTKSVKNCYTVAKRPNMQVWGGNVYSSSGINTSVAVKYNVLGYNGTYPRIFGSWGELGVIANGEISGFASGTTTAYDGQNLAANSGGGTKTDFCSRSPLTFANNKCNTGTAGSIGTMSKSENQAVKDKEAVIAKLIDDTNNAVDTNEVNLNDGNSYYKNSNNIKIVESALTTDGIIKVVHAKNIYVAGNIQFAEANYESLGEIPKVLLYADENIYIDCNITRIDALLMAEKEVKTCADENGNVPDANSESRSKQLKVNGAIIASKLSPDRTYGAATGNNSIVPAEIINFDPTLYLWAGPTDDDDNSVSGSLETTYIREMAPRQ